MHLPLLGLLNSLLWDDDGLIFLERKSLKFSSHLYLSIKIICGTYSHSYIIIYALTYLSWNMTTWEGIYVCSHAYKQNEYLIPFPTCSPCSHGITPPLPSWCLCLMPQVKTTPLPIFLLQRALHSFYPFPLLLGVDGTYGGKARWAWSRSRVRWRWGWWRQLQCAGGAFFILSNKAMRG